MTQQWDSGTKNSNITLSNANLTGTNGAASYDSARGTEGFSAGRYYYEVVLTATGVSGAGFVSFSAANPSFNTGDYVGVNQYGVAYFSNTSVLNSGGSVATFGSFTFPVTMCMAIDFNSNLIWWRPGIAANWNNAAIGSQNPAVGSQVGGVAIPSSMLTDGATNSVVQAIYPAFTLNASGDTALAHFASSSWSGTAPTGFGPFDPATGIPLPAMSLSVMP